jgi:hypothetical protein
MTSLVSASQVVTGQVQSLDSVRAHALPSDALIFASATKVQPANQNLGSYAINDQVSGSTPTINGSVPAVTLSPFADLYKEGSVFIDGVAADYISTSLTGYTMSQGISMEMFVNYVNFTNSTYTIGFMAPSAATYNFTLGVNGSAAPIVTWTGGTLVSSVTVSANTWNHLACSWDGTTLRLYVNGALGNSTTSFTPPTLAQNFLVGRANSLTCTAYVTDVRIVTNPAVYVASTLTVPAAPLSPAAAGTTNFLLRVGSNSPTVQNGALTFDRGLKQYQNFGPMTFNIVTQGFTAVWRGTLTGVIKGFDPIFVAGPIFTNGWIALLRSGSTSTFYLAFAPSNAGTQAGASGTFTLNQNTAYVITARYSPSTQLVEIWVNGVNQPAATATITTASLVGDRTTNGAYLFTTGTTDFNSASMNTLAVYNRALSNVEILNAYSALTTSTVNAPIEIGDVNGTPALSIAGDGRVNITKMGQTSNVLPWPPAAMTGYVTSINGQNYVASASTDNGYGTSPAWYAFDKNSTGTAWISSASYGSTAPYASTAYTTTDVNGTAYLGEWLQIQQPSAVTLSSYSITPGGNAASGQAPAKWALLGSRDGTNWTLVDSRAGITTWAATTAQTFSVSASQAWTYFRCVVTQANGYVNSTSVMVFAELTLYGTADTAQTLTIAQPVTLSYGAQTASLTGISGDKYVPQDFSSSGLNVPAYVVSNTATVANTVQYSSFGPFAGEGSFQFNGGAIARVAFPPGTSANFNVSSTSVCTFEFWAYPFGPKSTFISHTPSSGNYDWGMFMETDKRLGWYSIGGAGIVYSTNAMNINAWNHCSFSFTGGGTVYIGLNGTVNSGSMGAPGFTTTALMTIGNDNFSPTQGYIASARIVSGLALYTTSFTPPTGPLQPIQGTTQAGLPYGTVLLLRNAPAPGRVLTSKFGGANSGGVLSFPPAAMTSYATVLNSGYGQGTYVASASSEYSPGGATYPNAWYAFDKSASTSWVAANGGYNTSSPYNYTGSVRTVDVNGTSYSGDWLQIQMPSSIILSTYSIKDSGDAQKGPGAWSILGSRDGAIWFLVDQRSGVAYSTSLLNFSVTSAQAFTYYRMVITNATGTGTFPELIEWTLNGTIEGPNVTADGRLGVGVSNPVQALEVAGSAVVAGTLSAGNPLMFRNALYNGDMRIAQRGTSFVGTAGYGYTLDRWYGTYYGAATAYYTISQIQSGLPNFSNALQLQQTSTNNMNAWLSQSLETRDVVRFQGQPVTVSFWYRIPVSFTQPWVAYLVWNSSVDAKISDSGISFTIAGSLSLTNTTAWTYASFQAFVPPTAQSMAVQFVTVSGAINGAQFQVTGVQLEKGTVATPYEIRPYATELALCQRYYFRTADAASSTAVMVGGVETATLAAVAMVLPVTMRIAPTGALGSGIRFFSSATSGIAVSINAQRSTATNAGLYVATAGGCTTGQVCYLYNFTTSSYIEFNSEL